MQRKEKEKIAEQEEGKVCRAREGGRGSMQNKEKMESMQSKKKGYVNRARGKGPAVCRARKGRLCRTKGRKSMQSEGEEKVGKYALTPNSKP